MNTSKVVGDDIYDEFDFSKARPSQHWRRAGRGVRFSIVTDDADRPSYHLTGRRDGNEWILDVDAMPGQLIHTTWDLLEVDARNAIAHAFQAASESFDLVIDIPPGHLPYRPRRRYTLWHLGTGNLIGDFSSKSSALAAVRHEIDLNGDAEDLVLQLEPATGKPQYVGSGDALMAMLPRKMPSTAGGTG